MKNSWIILILIIVPACKSNIPEKDDLQKVFRYNESKGITSLDPLFARNQTLIWPVTQLFNGLVQMDDQLEVIPCIAKRWETINNSYIFYLRDDVYFHDDDCFPEGKGRKVTAHDFVYSFSRLMDPSVASPGTWVFARVEKNNQTYSHAFQAIDDTTLIIRLNEPFPPFLSLLTMPYCFVVPEEAINKYKTEFSRNPVGTGPFRFHTWREDEKLILTKNEKYFETDSAGLRLPHLSAVSISFIKDKQSEFLEFLKGNLDILIGVHPAYKDELLTRSGKLNPKYRDRLNIITGEYLNTEYFGFLLDKDLSDENTNPLLNINVRKAINYGIDRAKMMKYLRNNIGAPALSGFIPDGMPSYNAEIKGYSYFPDTARYFLEKANFPNGKGLPEILLTTTSDYLDLCEYIQFELAGIGIKIKIEVATGAAFRNSVANANLTFFRGSWVADYPDAENYLMLFISENFSPAGPNTTHFSNSEFDELYHEAIKTEDNIRRYAMYNKMDSILIEHAAVVPLYYDRLVRFTSKEICGLPSNPMNLLVLKNVKKQPLSNNSGISSK